MRKFSSKQRYAVAIVTDRDGEADHIVPYARGGQTTVENCQMIGSVANRRKGAFLYKPREWQKNFQHAWDARTKKSFLLIVIPGGGKTMAALEACRRWMAAGSDRRIIVVVPTVNLREQWQEEAAKFGIELQSKEFGTNFKHGFQGGVTTYSFVANNSGLFRKLCSVAATMVVFDEIHHCGDEAHFGRGVTDAFELAKEKLLLSGTPWKTDGTPIPYVTYDGSGYAVGDFFYDYPMALNESVVRYLVFDYSRGTITNDVTGQTDTLCSELTDDEASRMLLRLLDPRGEFVREQIRQAHQKLLEVRAITPDAAALAACVDQAHAVQVAETIYRVTGCRPSVIVSDSELENDSVREFRKGRGEWLVAVRKVSEGVDIKRLQVLCYLTNTVTELFFRQLIGRVSRYRGGEDREGYVFLPSDPRLIRCAQNIENAQVQALREQATRESTERDYIDQEDRRCDSFSTAHAGTELVMIGSEAVPCDQAEQIKSASEKTGVPMQKVLEVLRAVDGFALRPEPEQTPMTMEEEMNDLRDKCHKKAFQLAAILTGRGDPRPKVKEIHLRFKPQSEMTKDELRRKLSTLIEEINRSG